ncbi:MAG: RluA family pseudouridine synthase [Paludibacteraceae bacterium]|nr:RluA family pseudouridine synthase [Paludibacteraceae bacterium]MBQ1851402.1 RluA family pseudouridine synthase [Paludibacteraceae bacterium]MBQ2064822.1 RluA family pseudouridine synthase [Paludibacteraceae bacterium]MBQ5524176.1 RluA family pseudouridine synthase [Paludibacteraceae bacterium]
MVGSEQKKFSVRVTEDAPLMEFLEKKLSGYSRNTIKALIKHRQLLLDGHTVLTRHDYPLKKGGVVDVLSSAQSVASGLNHPKLSIIFEDEHIIVVEKKEGLLSVKTPNTPEESATHLLNQYLRPQGRDHYIYVVHRLDRETSGVMMFAKSKEVQQTLRDNWKKYVTERSYVAIVDGVIEQKKGRIESYLTEDIKKVMHSSPVDNGGQLAITNYTVISTNGRESLVRLNLETGRKNQIRVQLQSIEHPVAGDVKYGSRNSRYGRLCLHAETLRFKHPVTGKPMAFSVPVPFKLS